MQGFLGGVARGPRRVFEDPKIAAVVSAGTRRFRARPRTEKPFYRVAKENRVIKPALDRTEPTVFIT